MEHRWFKFWPAWAPRTLEVGNMPTSEYIRDWARITPGRIALTFFGRDIAYEELNNLIDRMAWGLVDMNVKKGDRVALFMENCPQFVIAYFGIQRAGGIVVPVNPMFRSAEIEYEVNDAGAETLICFDTLYAEFEKVRDRTTIKNVIITTMSDYLPEKPTLPVPEEPQHGKTGFPDTFDFVDLLEKSSGKPICRVDDIRKDLALLQYTGGTTGTPKGAMITHHALASGCVGTMFWWHVTEYDVCLGVTPFFHSMGQVTLMGAPLVGGARILVFPRFIPKLAAQATMMYHVSYWVAAPPMIIGLLNLPDLANYDLSSFRCIVTGGTTIPVDLQEKLKKVSPNASIVEGYGLTETALQGGAATPIHQYRPGFVGIPALNSIMKIVDKETQSKELGPNEEGEILIKSVAIMQGYWNKPEATKEMLRDGWLYTGDIGLMDEQGYVKFLGRNRDLIKCSGFSVFPAEVEDLLFKHPAVKDAAVIGVSDSYRGESVKAFIVARDEQKGKITAQEIIDWCKENMAAYKRPRFVEFRDDLPKNAAGKLLRRVLVEEETRASAEKENE